MQSYLRFSYSIVLVGLLGTACKKEVMINPDRSASIGPTLSGVGHSSHKGPKTPHSASRGKNSSSQSSKDRARVVYADGSTEDFFVPSPSKKVKLTFTNENYSSSQGGAPGSSGPTSPPKGPSGTGGTQSPQ